MRLSLLTFSLIKDALFRRIDAETICQICQDNGIESLDLLSHELGIYGIPKLKAAMAAHGVSCGSIVANIDFLEHPETADEELTKALSQCNEIGTKTLMIVPGREIGKKSRRVQNLSREAMLDEAVVFFRGAVRAASERGIAVGLEDTPQASKPYCNIPDMQYLFENVPGLKLILDTGNIFVGDPAADLMTYYEAFKGNTVRVHLKDVVVGSFPGKESCVDGQQIAPVVTGSGILPMGDFIAKLKADGYDGDLSIEYAAPGNVHGAAHSEIVGYYADYIRHAWAGDLVKPEYITIPGLDKPVSRIFFGTAMMPLLMGKESDALLDGMFAQGVNAFDCARGYGRAENALGAWMKHRNNRERVVILSKCGNAGMGGRVHIDRKVISRELDASLKALGTDYIDIYLLHRDDPKTPVGEIMDCLNAKQRQGKIKVFGVSNWTPERIREANEYAARFGLNGFAVSSPNFGLAEQVEDPWGGECVTVSGAAHAEDRKWYAKEKMPVLAYSSLGRGFFAGKFKSGDYEGAKAVLDGAAQKGYLHPVNMERLARCEELAEKKGCSVSDIAMRYIFGSEMTVCALVSTSKPSRMRQNVEASLHPLTKKEIKFLEEG